MNGHHKQMKMHTVIYNAYDVIVVPFPFTDRTTSKRRPALVLSNSSSFNQRINHSVMAMITSAKNSQWPLDNTIKDLDSAGLSSSSIVRMKLFTLDNRLVIRKAGTLSTEDQLNVKFSLDKLFKKGELKLDLS